MLYLLQTISFNLQVQLIRIQLRVPEYGWTTQKVFHLLNFAVNGSKDACTLLRYYFIYFCEIIWHLKILLLTVRAVQFGLYRSVFHIRPNVSFLQLHLILHMQFFLIHAWVNDIKTYHSIHIAQFTQFANIWLGKL